MSLLNLFTRPTKTKETPMPQNAETTETAWPEGVTDRYVTFYGATFGQPDITTNVARMHSDLDDFKVECHCGHRNTYLVHDRAKALAQSHAETCRALPRPTTH